jgi:stage V sporulation protein G
MDITEVRIKLMEDSDDRLRAFCSVTFDSCFVVRDLKIIDGVNGPFVAMPSRKLTSHCPQCGSKNHLRASYCNQCGGRLSDDRAVRDQEGRVKLYADIAHPINSTCRETIQDHVITEYEAELERAEQPGYASRYDEGYEEDAGEEGGYEQAPGETSRPQAATTHIEPAEATPPPPHQAPVGRRAADNERADGEQGFGAGIFDD